MSGPLRAQDAPRCSWARQDPLLQRYHDEEWGLPLHDDRRLFECLILEGAQAGLSWRTVLVRREHYRAAFHDFDIDRVAAMSDAELARCLLNPGLIRHRQKIEATRRNAQASQQLIRQHGSLDRFFWSFVEAQPVDQPWRTASEVPASTPLSDQLSKTLRKAGFGFVGSTICYAFMQAIGMVNDHLADCICRHPHAVHTPVVP
ncbi:DNA-3-methyladenine glycosylase I [Frateuria aurantia]